MDDTWVLSWSRRWHKINPEFVDAPLTHCGRWVHQLYRQDYIRDATDLRHLKVVLAEPEKAAGVCIKCQKLAAKSAPK